MSSLLVGLVVAPLVGSVIALAGKLLPWKRATAAIAASSILANVVFVIGLYRAVAGGDFVEYAMGGWPGPLGIVLRLDGLGWIASVLVITISVPVLLAALSREADDPRFFFFLLILISGMQAVVLTTDLFNMFVSFEIVAISAYVLIAYEKTTAALVASVKYLILSTVGILFFLIGILIVYRSFGVLSFAGIAEALSRSPGRGDSGVVHLAIAALCVGIGVRTAFIPFHTWLPEAHAYAPHPVSAMLSGVLIKVSFLGMVRVLTVFEAGYLNELLLWIGASTALLAVIWALSQSDAKRLLAYHSISQMGYILAAFGAAGAFASLAHAVNHALFKSLLFLTVGAAVDVGGTRNLYEIRGVGARRPLLMVAFLVGALSIAGVPLFSGYGSKQLISAALKGHAAYALIWITGVGTVASFIKLSRIYLAPRRTDDPQPRREGTGSRILLGVGVTILAVFCMATGLVPGFFARLYARLGIVAGNPTTSYFAAGKLLETGLVLALGAGLYFLATSPPARTLTHRVRALSPDIETVLVFFCAGLGLFALVAYL